MIILLGLPKSGTCSFQQLFTTLEYKSYHYFKNGKYIGNLIKDNKKKNKPLLCDFLNTDVITQMDVCVNTKSCYWPQIVDYKQIVNENTDSIFILNKRNPEELLSSFKRWGNLDKRLFKYNPEIIADKTDKGFINFVNNFYLEIESYFAENQNIKFLSYDICNDKIEKLKKYIDIKNIEALPRINQNPKKKL